LEQYYIFKQPITDMVGNLETLAAIVSINCSLSGILSVLLIRIGLLKSSPSGINSTSPI
jgi:hypothetical protein